MRSSIFIAVLCILLLIAPASATLNNTPLLSVTPVTDWSNWTITAPFAGMVMPVVQGVTSIDNIDQSLDPGWAAANTYALGTSVSESATNLQTFAPTKNKITNISIYSTATGTGLTWYLVVHDASNNILASTQFTPVSGVNSVPVPCLWTSGNLHFHVYASATTGTPTLKAGTSNDLETGSYIQYYAKNTEDVSISANGTTLNLYANGTSVSDPDGLLPGATVDLTRGMFNWTGPFSDYKTFSSVYSASIGGGTSNSQVVNGWDTTATPWFYSASDGTTRYVTWKVNTVLPVDSVSIGSDTWNAGTATNRVFQVSGDGVNWITLLNRTQTGAEFLNQYNTTNQLAGNKTIYVRFTKIGDNYLLFRGPISVNATLNTTAPNATLATMTVPAGTPANINISSSGSAVSSSLDPSMQANVWLYVDETGTVILPPIVQWVTDKTTVIFPQHIMMNETFIRDGVHDPTSWNYTPGDGRVNISYDLRNVSYQYVKRGVWNASLTVSNSAGTNTSYKIIRVLGYQ